jgi:hypothetical protein
MNAATDRARAPYQEPIDELDAHERILRTLLSMIEGPVTDLDGLVRAGEFLAARRFDAERFTARFRDASAGEVALVRRRLERLADLDAVVRSTCVREMAACEAAIERVRRLRAQLDALRSIESPGEALDCVR